MSVGVENVFEVLSRAASQSMETLRPAEQQLKEWETHPGFYSSLFAVYSNAALPLNVRFLSVLYIKNGVDRYWRKTAKNALQESEKDILRSRLTASITEPHHQLATQLSVLIARIARLDCPRHWPQLLPSLLEGVQSKEPLTQQRALLTLKHVTASLASKRLLDNRKVFRELTEKIFKFILMLWVEQLEQVQAVAACGQDSDALMLALDKNKLAGKVLRLLFLYGFQGYDSEEAKTFFSLVVDNTPMFLHLRVQLAEGSKSRRIAEKTALLCIKVMIECQENSPLDFLPFLKDSLLYITHYVIEQRSSSLLFEQFIVQCFVLMKNILKCEKYRPPRDKDEAPSDSRVLEGYEVKMSFFTYEMLVAVCQAIVSHYFLLTQEELDEWKDDPEAFSFQEAGDAWKFSLRPCVEVVFMSLVSEFRLTLCPSIVQMVNQVQGPVNPEDTHSVLLKDAVYNAAGLVSFDLFDDIDFDKWFTAHLVVEVNERDPRLNVLRRRVILLMGQWVGVKMAVDLRPSLYEILFSCLAPGEDLVIRLTASKTLQDAIDEFNFRTEQFLPYLERACHLLFQLLYEVEECETKMYVLQTFSLVIERVGPEIQPHAMSLIQYLPELWQRSADHNLLQCGIVVTLKYLVQALAALSVSLHPLVVPIIQYGTDLQREAHIYLLEDSLELWHVVLMCSPQLSVELLQLFSNMSGLLELGTENLRVCLKVIDSYVLLGAAQLLQLYSGILIPSFISLLRNVKPEAIVMIMQVISNVVLFLPAESPSLLKPLLTTIFQNMLQDQDYPPVINAYLSVWARLLLQNASFFSGFLSELAAHLQQLDIQVFNSYLDLWIDKLDTMTQPHQRKLTALALCSLLTSGISGVTERFAAVIEVCNVVLHEVHRCDEDGHVSDSLVTSSIATIGSDEDDDETAEDARKRALRSRDPVHTVCLRDLVATKLSELHSALGDAHFRSLMETVDTETKQQLQAFLDA